MNEIVSVRKTEKLTSIVLCINDVVVAVTLNYRTKTADGEIHIDEKRIPLPEVNILGD